MLEEGEQGDENEHHAQHCAQDELRVQPLSFLSIDFPIQEREPIASWIVTTAWSTSAISSVLKDSLESDQVPCYAGDSAWEQEDRSHGFPLV